MDPESVELVTAGRHGSKQQAWQRAPETERSHPNCQYKVEAEN